MTDVYDDETTAVDLAPQPATGGPSLRRGAYVAAIHARRLPLYWLRVLAHTPRGAARLVRAVQVWTSDAAGAEQLATLADNRQLHKLVARHDATAKRRRIAATVVVIEALLVLAGLAVVFDGRAVLPAAAVGLLLLTVLGLAGRAPDEPIIGRVVTADGSPPLTSSLILTALGSIGIGELNRAIAAAERDGRQDGGVGWPHPDPRGGQGVARRRRPAPRCHRHPGHRAPGPAGCRAASLAVVGVARG